MESDEMGQAIRTLVGVACMIKLEFHGVDTDILARILATTSDARFPELIPVASSTTRRHSRDDPREDVDEDVGVGVGVVECQLNKLLPAACVSAGIVVTGRAGDFGVLCPYGGDTL